MLSQNVIPKYFDYATIIFYTNCEWMCYCHTWLLLMVSTWCRNILLISVLIVGVFGIILPYQYINICRVVCYPFTLTIPNKGDKRYRESVVHLFPVICSLPIVLLAVHQNSRYWYTMLYNQVWDVYTWKQFVFALYLRSKIWSTFITLWKPKKLTIICQILCTPM